jgi:hypothetical protein
MHCLKAMHMYMYVPVFVVLNTCTYAFLKAGHIAARLLRACCAFAARSLHRDFRRTVTARSESPRAVAARSPRGQRVRMRRQIDDFIQIRSGRLDSRSCLQQACQAAVPPLRAQD